MILHDILFVKYYVPLVEIKDFNVLIDNKPFFDQPIINKQEAYEKRVEMSRNDVYTRGNLLDYLICTTTINMNSLLLIYQDEQLQEFLNKLILQKN